MFLLLLNKTPRTSSATYVGFSLHKALPAHTKNNAIFARLISNFRCPSSCRFMSSAAGTCLTHLLRTRKANKQARLPRTATVAAQCPRTHAPLAHGVATRRRRGKFARLWSGRVCETSRSGTDYPCVNSIEQQHLQACKFKKIFSPWPGVFNAGPISGPSRW